MRCSLTIFVIFLIHYAVSKETAVYQVSGVELIDLLRGYAPEEKLKLTKVEGDRSSLPYGIYFEPEDDDLAPPEEPKYLSINGQRKNYVSDKKQDGVTTSN